MYNQTSPRRAWALPVSLMVALLLLLLPVDQAWLLWRPEWVAMVLSFWLLNAPGALGYFSVALLGLSLDLLLALPVGSYAFSFMVLAWLAQGLRKWPGVRSIVQTTLLIGFYIAVVRVIRYGVVDSGTFPESYYAVLSSMLLWPALMLVMRRWVRYV